MYLTLDYHLFAPMKTGLRGKNDATDEEVKPAVMKRAKTVLYEGKNTSSHLKIEHYN